MMQNLFVSTIYSQPKWYVLKQLEHWDREFESLIDYVFTFLYCTVLCR